MTALARRPLAVGVVRAKDLFPVKGEDGFALRLAHRVPDMAINWGSSPNSSFQGDPFSKLSITRTTTGTHVNAGGLLVSAAAGAPRFDYDPTTLQPRGLLIEGQKVNQITRSEDFSHAAWNPTNVTVTANDTVAPDGTTTADRLNETTANSRHAIFFNAITTPTTGIFTFSAWLKQGSVRYCLIRIESVFGSETNYVAVVDLRDGLITQTNMIGTTSAPSATQSRIIGYPNGWWRAEVTMQLDHTLGHWCGIGFTNNSATPTHGVNNDVYYAGNTAQNFYVWGGQCELHRRATSYIPSTAGSTTTKNCDAITLPTSAVPFSATAGTFLSEFMRAEPIAEGVIVQVSGGADAEMISCDVGNPAFTDTAHRFVIIDNGVHQTVPDEIFSGTVVTLRAHRGASAWAANDAANTMDGGTTQLDTSLTLPTVTGFAFGGRDASGGAMNEPLTGWLREIVYLPRRMANADLEAWGR